ncbi:MAG: hypothetical protein ACSHWZ_00165 [Sulfitobacter sp.]
MFKTISAAALIAAMATTSYAGALSDPIIEVPPVVEVAGSSSGIGAPAVLGAVVAAAALAALVSDDDDDATATTVTGD